MCITYTGLVMWKCADRWEQNQSYPGDVASSHHAKAAAETATDYYKCIVTIPLLDHVLMELNTRNSIHQGQAIQGLCLYQLTALVAFTPEYDNQKLKSLTSLYTDDLPFPGSVKSEYTAGR